MKLAETGTMPLEEKNISNLHGASDTSSSGYAIISRGKAGQQFVYGFDDIGNRIITGAGGDASGGNLRGAWYESNELNQYESRDVPGALDIIGAVYGTASGVTVNNVAATRQQVEYWRAEVQVNNANGPVYQTITAMASTPGEPNETLPTKKVYVPAASETFTYDADGNLSSDGRWNYTWDAENRLVGMSARSGSDSVSSIAFKYDYRSRRTYKKVSLAGSTHTTNQFVYDGWNPIAEFDGGGTLQKSFVWGKDLSGTEQGAGGVGGLVMLVLHTDANANTYFPSFDGNGNLTALFRANTSTADVRARYEYDPFHNVIRSTGAIAKDNYFLAATKYYNWECGLYFYGFRYYEPDKGNWLSRDLLEEKGGFHLFCFTFNSPLDFIDPFGLSTQPAPSPSPRFVPRIVPNNIIDFPTQPRSGIGGAVGPALAGAAAVAAVAGVATVALGPDPTGIYKDPKTSPNSPPDSVPYPSVTNGDTVVVSVPDLEKDTGLSFNQLQGQTGPGKWLCQAKAHVTHIASQQQKIGVGYGAGKNLAAAKAAALSNANTKVPRGCYQRHVHYKCAKVR